MRQDINNGLNMNMTDEWEAHNKMVGRVLTYLDEANVGTGIKKAVKSELWDFYNEYVKENDDDETRFNR